MDINDLYFGAQYWDSNEDEMVTFNVFDCGHVKYWIARWMTNHNHFEESDIFRWAFSDYTGKCEWEWTVNNWPEREGLTQKTDVWHAYLEPNRDYLTRMMERVSLESCKEYLKTHKQ